METRFMLPGGQGFLEVEILPKEEPFEALPDENVRLSLVTGDTSPKVLDYYESVGDAWKAAEYFGKCWTTALGQGFELRGEYFVNQKGHSVPIQEALVFNQPISVFRKALREEKVQKTQPRRNPFIQ